MNKSGKKPFLEKVMFRNSINIFVHKPEPMSDFIKLKASLCYSANAELWFSDLPKKNMAPILEVFNSTEISIKFGDNLFSFKDIIEDLGDKFGGAHIDEKIDRKKLLVFSNSIIIRGFNINSSVTLCTGKSLLIAIEKIIKFIETGVVDDFLVKT